MNRIALELQAERYLERVGRGDLPVVIVAEAGDAAGLERHRARAAELVEAGHVVELIVIATDAALAAPEGRCEGERWIVVDGPTLRGFLASRRFVDVLVGPYGSGKTVAASLRLFLAAYRQEPGRDGVRRTKWIVLRTSYSELEHTTSRTWREWFGRYGVWRQTAPFRHLLSYAREDGTRVAAEVIFLALDHEAERDKLGGFEVTGAFVNELREVPRGIFDVLTGRVDRYPRRRDGGGGGATWAGVIADTNPCDEDHWLAKLMGEPPPGWAIRQQPGGMVQVDGRWVENPRAENRANLSARYYANMIAGKGEDWIRVHVGGRVGFSRDGQPVLPEYDDVVHAAHDALKPLAGHEVVVGLDAGLWPAAVFVQRDGDGRILILDELVGEGVSARDFALHAIVPLLGSARYAEVGEIRGAGDPAGLARSANADDRRSWLAIVEEHAGIPCRPAPTQSLVARREALAQPMTRLIGGRPGLLVSPHCRTLRRAFSGGWHLRRLRVSGEERYTEKPEKNRWSHPADAASYACLALGEHYGPLARARRAKRRNAGPVMAITAYPELGGAW